NFGGGITAVRGLAFDPAGPTLYGCDDGNNRLVRININSGAATNVGGTFGGAFTNIRGFAYDTGGTTLYGTDTGTGQLVSVNTTTGTATAVGETGFSICGLAY
ncbi:MAG: hypothetical protein L6Q71_11340, partial [Planctomycetes bacterium]|nr:hypothetical protein [Planctomycetota bacterium]